MLNLNLMISYKFINVHIEDNNVRHLKVFIMFRFSKQD